MLYVFGGEQASGAEIVIERLMSYNLNQVEPHLFISPGKFADNLIASNKPYPIITIPRLKKLNRSSGGKAKFYLKALGNYFSISRQVLSYASKHKIDIVHANTVVPASYLLPAITYAKATGNKLKWIWSDHDIRHFSKLDHYFSDLCCKLFNKTLVVSNAVKSKYINSNRVEVLYNGLDSEYFKPGKHDREAFRTKNNLEDNDIVIGIAATISPRKGQVELVEVFKELPKDKSIRLIIAGGFGPDDLTYNKRFQEIIKDLPGVSYLGHFSDMVSFYNGCDIIINNSTAEGSEPLGTTIYEAMACEKIVIASNTGGTSEIITDNQDGFTFSAENKAALKRILVSVINSEVDLKIVQTNARKKAIEKFSIAKMAGRYNEIINN